MIILKFRGRKRTRGQKSYAGSKDTLEDRRKEKNSRSERSKAKNSKNK